VDKALAQGVIIMKAKRLRGQEMVEARRSIRIAIMFIVLICQSHCDEYLTVSICSAIF